MTIATEKLIQNLIERTQTNINQAEKFKTLSIENLNWKEKKDTWSILECLEHLNLYGNFYTPEITKQIEKAKTIATKNFRSGLLGNYFAKMMLPGKKSNKMKTFEDKDPINTTLDKTVIDHFIAHQEALLNLLNLSMQVDLNKTKTAISISKFIKLKLGDTFRVVIYHNDRHIAQANKIVSAKF